jgi:hypothetical protein
MAQEFVIPAEIPATFTRAPGDDVVWVHHPETGNYAQLALAAVPGWTGRGWQVTDEPPPEVDPTRAHLIGLPPPEPEPDVKPARASRSKRAAEPESTDEPVDDTATESEEGVE